jgi:hypothetical protein
MSGFLDKNSIQGSFKIPPSEPEDYTKDQNQIYQDKSATK